MPHKAVPAFMAKLARIDSTTSQALQFLILTAARSGEALGARWDEINFDAAVWTVPANRMKTGEIHEVPLSDAALAILYAQREARGQNPHIISRQADEAAVGHGDVDAGARAGRGGHRAWLPQFVPRLVFGGRQDRV